jgi:4-hydroxyacetophenone monooxygenase
LAKIDSVVEPATKAELADALVEADRRTLAAVLTHLTGDVDLVPDIRDREHILRLAAELLPKYIEAGVVEPPSDEVLDAAMALAAGGVVPSKYGPFVREQMAIGPAVPSVPVTPPGSAWTIAIIGAGVTGLALAHYLDSVGLSEFTIFEKRPSVGGTWWSNRYPGCRVDTPSLLYSYSFNTDPGWPHHFSFQPSLLEYMRDTAVQFEGRIKTSTTVERLEWDERRNQWQVTLRTEGAADAEQIFVDIVLGATGFLSSPRLPVIPGMASFTGPAFHSSQWDTSVDVTGRRVAVIGTGASANQIVPAISSVAEHVTVFQRSPHWVTPHPYYGKPLTGTQRYLIEQVPSYLQWFRFRQFWVVGDGILSLMRRDPSWPHPERAVNAQNDALRETLTEYINEQLADHPDLRERVLPDFPPYAKRMIVDNGWYASLGRPNVSLVTEPIKRITPAGAEVEGESIEVDVIVYATGFNTNQVLNPIQIIGRSGVDLRTQLNQRPESYYGIALKDCPNLFMTSGPNGVTVHGGAGTLLAEIQCSYIVQCLRMLSESGASNMVVKDAALEEFTRSAKEENAKYAWSTPGVTNWYAAGGEGAAVAFPWSIYDLWAEAQGPDASAFTFGSDTNGITMPL